MNKCLLLISLLFFCTVSYVNAANETNPNRQVDGILRTIGLVDHINHRLVIDDEIYYMPLNFKVYIINQYSNKNRLANRYALKEGQSVFIGVETKSRKSYVNVLLIQPQK